VCRNVSDTDGVFCACFSQTIMYNFSGYPSSPQSFWLVENQERHMPSKSFVVAIPIIFLGRFFGDPA